MSNLYDTSLDFSMENIYKVLRYWRRFYSRDYC